MAAFAGEFFSPDKHGDHLALPLGQLVTQLGDAAADVAANPALRVARDETAAAEARVDLARRERFPVPAVQLGRTWTSGPFGATIRNNANPTAIGPTSANNGGGAWR